MNTEKFEVICFYRGEKLKVSCMRSEKAKSPEILVHLRCGARKEEAFTFYEVNKRNTRLFWFPHEGERQELAQGIAAALERQLFVERKLAFYNECLVISA